MLLAFVPCCIRGLSRQGSCGQPFAWYIFTLKTSPYSKGLVEVKLPYPYSTSSAWRQS